MRRFLFHPSAAALGRFAHGEASPPDASSTAAHLLTCPRCRTAVEFQRDVSAAAKRVDVPSAPPSVLARVLAERAEGVRAILPTADSHRRAPTPMIRVAAVVLLAITGAALAIRAVDDRQSVATAPADAGADSLFTLHDLFVSAGFLPGTAYASELPARPAVPPISGIDGTRLRPTRVMFESRWVDSTGRITVDGQGRTELSPATYQGMAAWRIDHHATMRAPEDGGLRVEAETLWVRRDNLAPLARSVHVSPYLRFSQITIRQRFTGDSVFGDMNTDGGVHRAFAQRLPSAYGPYTTDVLAPFFLGAVELGPSWRGSISIVGWAVRSYDVLYSSTLEVTGTERVALPAGPCDCWKMRIATAAGTRSYWVRKSDGLGMRVRVDAAQPGKGFREFIITDR